VLSQFFDEKFFKTQEFRDLSPLFKIYTMIGSLFLTMSTYVIGFCFMETGCHASGISFNGYDDNQNPRFDRIKSVSIVGLMTSYRVGDFLKAWNSSV
jgi:hypothetical protein